VSKTPIIYTLTSLTCRESWPEVIEKWCFHCCRYLPCGSVVERMTTDPGCPLHATTDFPSIRAAARVVYRYPEYELWNYSCLSGALCGAHAGTVVWGRGRSPGSDEAAIAWLLGGP
jgi:hypothetical protein